MSIAIRTKKDKPKYEEGDLVRIAKPDGIFRQGYKRNYTDEVFTLFKVPQSTNIQPYRRKQRYK